MNISKIALFPFAVLYDGITRLKNALYNKGILKSTHFNLPVFVIGNLAVGGTGKTPHTEFLTSHLITLGKTAVLSRGYGRKTRGYIAAHSKSTAQEIGDEPLQISYSCPNAQVAVCEDRVSGINRLIKDYRPDFIVLDDAFQHRKLLGSFYILLTTYQKPFFKDFVLPAGRLRETRSNKHRANMIIVTKCPTNISKEEQLNYKTAIAASTSQKVFFTHIKYGQPKALNSNLPWQNPKEAIVVTGIVDPHPLKNHLESLGISVTLMPFDDHYMYTEKDLKIIESAVGQDKVLITTSKDSVKLEPLLKKHAKNIAAFELPITIHVLFNEENELLTQINKHVGIN